MEQATDPRPRAADAVAQPSTIIPFALIVALFFLWGMANNLNDILIAQFKKAFTLSDFRAGLVTSAFYLFPSPAGPVTKPLLHRLLPPGTARRDIHPALRLQSRSNPGPAAVRLWRIP